jgi:hypothetical protein
MDDTARRQLAFNIANNRTTANVAGKAKTLFDWMTALGAPGEQALIAANNQVAPQSSLGAILETAAANYEFVAGKSVPKAVAKAAAEGLTDPAPAAPEAQL